MATENQQLTVGRYVFDVAVDGPEAGEGVMLLHGFPQSAESWRRVRPGLAAAGYRVVSPDLRGYSPGARPLDPSEYRIAELVGDVVGLADELGWERFHLVGHDWGGALAWQVAGRHPDRLLTLTSISTPHPAAFLTARRSGPSADGDDQAAKSRYMDDFRTPGFEDVLLADDSALLKMVMQASGMDDESAALALARFPTRDEVVGALNWYRGAEPTDADGMAPVTTPTLYLWSTEDIALGRTAAEATASCVQGPYRFVVLEGVSHWVPEEAAAVVVENLLAHFGAVGA